MVDFEALKVPFSPSDIEWRVSRGGVKNGKPWAIVLAYVTNRAIQDRLDSVAGPANWKNEYTSAPDGGILCGLSIKIDGEWVTKWDGAENTQVEAVKGGLSGAMKRAAVQWGIGRYLYNLTETFVDITPDGALNGVVKDSNKQNVYIKYNPPKLHGFALPPNTADTPTVSDADLLHRVREGLLKLDVAPERVDTMVEEWRRLYNNDPRKMLEVAVSLYNSGKRWNGKEWFLK